MKSIIEKIATQIDRESDSTPLAHRKLHPSPQPPCQPKGGLIGILRVCTYVRVYIYVNTLSVQNTFSFDPKIQYFSQRSHFGAKSPSGPRFSLQPTLGAHAHTLTRAKCICASTGTVKPGPKTLSQASHFEAADALEGEEGASLSVALLKIMCSTI